MNEFLADIYNTRESIGASQDTSDVEKLAEAQLLDEALRAEGVDIDKLPGETILKLAHQLLGDDSALVKAAAANTQPSASTVPANGENETFEEKVAQADFLGRVMAHSYWSEKTNIEKQAGVKEVYEGAKAGIGKAWGATKGGAGKAWGAVKGAPGKAGEGLEAVGRKVEKTIGRAAPDAGGPGLSSRTAKILGGATLAAGAGTLAAGGYGAHRALSGKDKKSSAIDMLAEKQAMEWAYAHGLIEPSDEEKLAAVVNQRAAEMLTEAGIDIEAVEAATR